MGQEFDELKRIHFKIYGTPQCPRCFNQWRIIQERFFNHQREKINYNELTDEELATLKLRNIPIVEVYDGDKVIRRFEEFVSAEQLKTFVYEYKKGLK